MNNRVEHVSYPHAAVRGCPVVVQIDWNRSTCTYDVALHLFDGLRGREIGVFANMDDLCAGADKFVLSLPLHLRAFA